MKRETTPMPASLRKAVLDKRDAANAAAKNFVANNRDGYENFVNKVEDPNAIGISGLYELLAIMGKCTPKKWMESLNRGLDIFFEMDDVWKQQLVQHLDTDEGWKEFEKHDCRMEGTPLEIYLRLIGKTQEEYKAGIIQVLQYFLLIRGRFNTEYMVNLMDLVLDGDELATYTYYYLAFEDGFKKVTDKLASLWMDQKYRQKVGQVFGAFVPSLVETSAAVGITDKTAWREFADNNEDDDVFREVNGALRHVDNNHGKKKEYTSLTEMLVDDKEGEVVLGIGQFIEEHKESVAMAYLLLALEKAKRVNCKSFDQFRQSVNQHFGLDIPYRKAQERYSELKEFPGELNNTKRKAMVKAKEIIQRWTEIFNNCA